MKLKSMEELSLLNELLNKCSGMVWIESANGEKIDLREESSRLIGLSRIFGEHAGEYGIYAQTREDKMLLFHFLYTRMPEAA